VLTWIRDTREVSVACDLMEEHNVQHCNVELDDFIHGT